MSAEEDTELRDLVAQTLEANGVLGKIRVRSFPVTCCGCTVFIDQYKCRVRLISLLANIRRLNHAASQTYLLKFLLNFRFVVVFLHMYVAVLEVKYLQMYVMFCTPYRQNYNGYTHVFLGGRVNSTTVPLLSWSKIQHGG